MSNASSSALNMVSGENIASFPNWIVLIWSWNALKAYMWHGLYHITHMIWGILRPIAVYTLFSPAPRYVPKNRIEDASKVPLWK